MVLMSFGSRAATDLCTLTPHCSQSERTLEKAMPCGSFTSALAMTVVTGDSLTVAMLEPDTPDFISPPSSCRMFRPTGWSVRPVISVESSHPVFGHFFLSEVSYVQVPVIGRAGRYRQFFCSGNRADDRLQVPVLRLLQDLIKHMEENGFEVKVVETEQLEPVKQQYGITRSWLPATPEW